MLERCDRMASPDDQYMARVCYLGRQNVVQLLTKDETHLLAERTFSSYGELVSLFWKDGELQYDDGDTMHLATIRLPPTLYDRLLARLP